MNVINKFILEQKQKLESLRLPGMKVKKKRDLRIKFITMDRNGIVRVKFNQEIISIPYDGLGRRLQEDMAKRYDALDLFTFIYVKNSEEDPKMLGFQVEMLEMTTTELKMNFTFENSLYVSRGPEKDKMKMQINEKA